MITTFLMAVVLFTILAVAGAAFGIYLFAEAKWDKHPLARCSYRRAASFASA